MLTRFCAGRAGRPPGRAADQIRACRQPPDRQGAWADDPGGVPRACRRGDRMRRREFISLLGGAAVSWPLAARAQQPDRIGASACSWAPPRAIPTKKPWFRRSRGRSRTLAGRKAANIRIERRWAEGDLARLRTQAAELARIAPDVLFAQGTPGTTALRQAAPTTPLVFVMITDPVSSGLVSSLGASGRQYYGFHQLRILDGREMAGTPESDRARHNPRGGDLQS